MDRTIAQLASERGLIPAGQAPAEADAAALVRGSTVAESELTRVVREESEKKLRCPVCAGGLRTRTTAGGVRLGCDRCGVSLGVGLELAQDDLSAEAPAEVRGAASDPSNRMGDYVLVRQVGTGGYGTVFRAWQKTLNRIVAIKRLHQVEDRAAQERFLREARLAAKLQHPNIVPVYEIGEREGKPYLAMEFVEGGPLHEKRLPLRRAVELMKSVAEAIHYAHEMGIVHRDLKPHNIMLAQDGRARVMDFGLARQTQRGSTLTAPDTILGTPAYMPPEQAFGNPVDRRGDVYSLGATLYQLVTGHPPFEGDSPLEILRQVTSEEIASPRKLNRRIPKDVETIILKSMERDLERRYATAQEMAEDLGRHLEGRPIRAVPAGWATRAWKLAQRHRTLTAVSCLLVLGGLAAGGAWRVREHRRQSHLRDLLTSAARAESTEEYGKAHDLYGEVLVHDPDHVGAAAKHVEMKERAAKQARQKSGASFLKAALEFESEYRSVLAEIQWLENKCLEVEKTLETLVPKVALWEAEQRLQRAKVRAADLYATLHRTLMVAVGADPENLEARKILSRLFAEEFQRSLQEGDMARAELSRRQALCFDDTGALEHRLAPEGFVVLETNPPGATVFLHRYEEGTDRRLIPRPAEPPILGQTPIRSRIPNGRYLLVLRKEGFRDVLYPVFVQYGTELRERVDLYREEEIGADFAYVPGGPFVSGGDREAFLYSPRAIERVEGFFLGRHEVTFAEYAEFLGHLVAIGKAEEFQRHLPTSDRPGQYLLGLDPETKRILFVSEDQKRWPVVRVAATSAEAYCRWRTQEHPKTVYRLPTSIEWEKAARGADGRAFPWGNRFDWTFAKGGRSRPGTAALEAVGAFPPDVSPYGVFDMSGGAREWCEDSYDQLGGMRQVRGGAFSLLAEPHFRCASRWGYPEGMPMNEMGFRVVKELPRR